VVSGSKGDDVLAPGGHNKVSRHIRSSDAEAYGGMHGRPPAKGECGTLQLDEDEKSIQDSEFYAAPDTLGCVLSGAWTRLKREIEQRVVA